MPYTKVSIVIEPYSQDAADILMAMMGEAGYTTFEDNATGFDAYIPTEAYDEAILNTIESPIESCKFSWTTTEIEDKNWNEEWEKNFFSPIVVSNKCVVRSPFHPTFPDVPIEIVIEPKMSFGTGHHETTAMMMEHILEMQLSGKRVLDMGCGTGILAILASKTGASDVVGIDIDSWCTSNSAENCQLNQIGNMDILLGDASLLENCAPFDVILANINRNILLNDIDKYCSVLTHGGNLIMSGFYLTDIPEIDACAKKHNLKLKSSKENNHWAAVAYERVD